MPAASTALPRGHRAEPSLSDRTNHHVRRDEAERLLYLAAYLEDEADRLLVEQVCQHGRPLRELATMRGTTPRLVERHYQSLIKHLKDPVYRYLTVNAALLRPEVRRTAQARYFGRRTLRDTAGHLGRSLHEVRKHITIVQAMARA